MKTKILSIVAAAFVVSSASSVRAHHAFGAEFDANKPMTLKGTVVKWELINPHSWIHMDVKGQDGKVERWMIESAPPNNLYRLGFTKESLPPGTEIVVECFQAKDGTNRASGKDIRFSDGRKLMLGLSQAPGAPQ